MHVCGSTHSLSCFSPCRSCLWYQLLLPASHTVTSFTYFSNVFYALLTTTSEVCMYTYVCVWIFSRNTYGMLPSSKLYSLIAEWLYISMYKYFFQSEAGLWVGVTGLSPVLQVYPSPGLEWLWSNSTSEHTPSDPTSFLASASLTLDTQGNLLAVRPTFFNVKWLCTDL